MSNTSPAGSCQWISLTPTKNESWIIRHFLDAAKLWADRRIVADQGSTDGTLETLRSTPGVEVIINDSPVFDEAHRQKILIDQARRQPGKRILIALDADEALSSNCRASADWAKIAQAAPGTVLRFPWVNILPGFEKAWIPPNRLACGFVDDGTPHNGVRIHSTRIPYPPDAPTLDLDEIVVLHFQYLLPERVVSKHRWYQAWEHVTYPEKSPLEIYRGYNHMNGSWSPTEYHPLDPAWLAGYDAGGVNYREVTAEGVTWWDREIVRLLRQHGPGYFRKIALWDKDWNAVARAAGQPGPDLGDPRSALERLAHRFLAASQSKRERWSVRALEKFLRLTGW